MDNTPKNKKEQEVLDDFQKWCEADQTTKGTSKIDKSEEQDWFSLSLGFFAAKGLSATVCHRLALHARYHMHYWR